MNSYLKLIIYMNRLILLFLLIPYCTIYAQTFETFYYKHTKQISNSIENTDVSGGQFITFSNDKCYDSDTDGFEIGNGILKLTDKSNGIITYSGQTYWGNAIYAFNSDKSILNVVVSTDEIYVYKRVLPPTGLTTSSLIKGAENTNSKTSTSTVTPPKNANIPSYNTGQSSYGNHSFGTDYNQQPKTTIRKKCPYCSGTGEKIQHEYVPTYGTNGARVYCSKCNQSWSAGTVHAHHSCRHCNGLGYTEYTY